jgi:hypothetical protein
MTYLSSFLVYLAALAAVVYAGERVGWIWSAFWCAWAIVLQSWMLTSYKEAVIGQRRSGTDTD